MDGSILYLPLSRFSSLLAALVAVFSFGVSAFAQPRLEGSLSKSNYTSPSGRLNCAMEGIPMGSPGFFIDDSSTPEFEGLTFGYDENDSFMVWVVRLQKDGRKDESPATSDKFPVTAETYIPYFYSELPYEIRELSQRDMEEAGGRIGLLEVQFEGSWQIHGYWIRSLDGWFQSVQLLPALSSKTKEVLGKKR